MELKGGSDHVMSFRILVVSDANNHRRAIIPTKRLRNLEMVLGRC